ncbi:Cna B-type domain-containing protein [Clostridium sp. Cult2]|uniref:Cna B-type domain-containing protein n=1 Tax=Clostridium sp. Cult2 TaxID=2079003 RepID=UPI001F3045CD|nr:Cna B-type domain-containing protein [Clostridium sp. Cult2]MCF6465839.1 hypothetical protein [Clostridium sp. Cult2]
MSINIKRILAILLVLILVIGTGFYTCGDEETEAPAEENTNPEGLEEGENPEQPEEHLVPEEPGGDEEPEELKEPVEPEEPEEPEQPEEPAEEDEDLEESTDSTDSVEDENLEEPTDLEGQILVYLIRYYLDGENPDSWEVEGVVSIDNPIVEEVSHENMPDGYIVDEDRSTKLPFEISEENNIIEVYYIENPGLSLSNIMPMAIATPGYYYSEEGVVVKTVLEGESINDHTIPVLIWLKNGIVYAAVKSTHELEYMTLNTVTSTDFDRYNPLVDIYVDDEDYKPEGLKGNVKDSHWTVFRFSIFDLPIPESGKVDFFIKGIGGGHDVGGYMTVIVPTIEVTGYKEWVGGENWPAVTLQLKRQVGLGPSEIANEGIVDGNETLPWSYTWEDMPEYNPYGQPYIYFIDEAEVPMYYEKTLDGLIVTNTFIPQGEITITKYVEDFDSDKDGDRKFYIFIYGPGDKVYTLSLSHGESNTITGLVTGKYRIEEVVPMNYELVSISPSEITLTFESNEATATVTNKRTNDGWFWDDPGSKVNIFMMKIGFVELTSNKGIDLASKDFALNTKTNPFEYISIESIEYFRRLQMFNEFEG